MKLAVLLACLGLVASAQAGPSLFESDHLKCYKVKDSATKEARTASFTTGTMGFENESGCVVKLPAKLLCNHVTKSNVTPPAPNMVSGQILTNAYSATRSSVRSTASTTW